MMDPLSALSLAGTVVQFVDFGSKLLSESFELYKSSRGTLEANEQLELVTGDLQSVIAKLRMTSNIVSEEPSEPSEPLTEKDQRQEDSFQKICEEAMQIAEELLNRLKALKIKGGRHRAWESLKAAVKCAWSKDEIMCLKQRLSIFKESLHSRLMLSMRVNFDAEAIRSSSRFDSLDARTQQILMAVLNVGGKMSQEILNSVTKMLCRFQALNQAEHHKTRQMVAEMRRAQSQSSMLEEITAQIEMLDVGNEEEQRLRSSVGRKILEYMPYPFLTDRYESVLEAHPQTFNWVFTDSTVEQVRWSDFRKWLRDDGGIYWINGKAGSGKSTLMKHIYDDPRTRQYLDQWSQQTRFNAMPICIATFFFWNSGTAMQKSQPGLLRSLLFQILGKHPNLLPIVFPARWARLYSGSLDLGQQIIPEPWSLRELEDAFERLIRQKEFPLKLCLFVDGLDEFDGDIDRLCILFKNVSLSNPENVKFCLSSRPWVQFQENFEGCASLRLQDLTFNDISIYVRDKFRQNQAFKRLETHKSELTSALIHEIVERADGVFLWVEVVVKQLLRGVNNRDSISQLWKRLRSFPKELYPLYETIISQIEPVYLEWASKAFQIMKSSLILSSDPFQKLLNTTPSSGNTTNEDTGTLPLTIATLFIALEEESDFDTIKSMSVQELDMMCNDTQIHLTARCAGLLEVAASRKPWKIQDCPIRYMHRTARDFLEQDAQWTKILSHTNHSVFSPHFAMMRSCILSLSRITQQTSGREIAMEGHGTTVSNIVRDALIYAYHANGHHGTRKSRTGLLQMLANMRIPLPLPPLHWMPLPCAVPPPPGMGFSSGIPWSSPRAQSPMEIFCLKNAVLQCLSDYVEDTLSLMDRKTRSHTAGALLDHLCDSTHLAEKGIPFPTAEIVSTLLRMSTTQRKAFTSRDGVWAGWLGVIGLIPQSSHIQAVALPRFVQARISVIEAFLTAGTTDPTDIVSHVPSEFVLCRKTFYETIMMALGENCEDIVLILDTLEKSLREAVSKWGSENCEKQLASKRKHDDEATAEGIPNKRSRGDTRMRESRNEEPAARSNQSFWEHTLD